MFVLAENLKFKFMISRVILQLFLRLRLSTPGVDHSYSNRNHMLQIDFEIPRPANT